MFCSNCGVENPAGSASCIQCGQPLGSVAATAPPAPSSAAPAPATAAPSTLATLLGLGGPAIEWGAPVAFLLASILADLAFLLVGPLLRLEGPLPIWVWISAFVADLFLTVAVVVAFRSLRNDAGAAALAAVGFTILQAVNQVVLVQIILHAPFSPPFSLVLSGLANFLFLLCLASAVRWLRPLWLGLWLGATVGQILAAVIYRLSGLFYGGLGRGLLVDLLFAAVFAFSFWGGLALLAPRVLRG